MFSFLAAPLPAHTAPSAWYGSCLLDNKEFFAYECRRAQPYPSNGLRNWVLPRQAQTYIVPPKRALRLRVKGHELAIT